MSESTPFIESASLPAVATGRAVVAMSGGVDSSVVAAMLHQEGYDVVGVSMRLYATASDAGKSCCSPDDLYDAREVADVHGFPFYVANYQEAFQERVVAYFVDEYRRGRTPSPCILCNDHLKFDVLLQRMLALRGAFLATGHYARVVEIDGRYALLRGRDRRKDQSYFLFGLARDTLAKIRFPLGDMTKDEVRTWAQSNDLPTATKAESQDICFVGSDGYAAFVEARLEPDAIRPGAIVRASSGEVLGEHAGIHRFTVGQRRGLQIAAPEPLYVKQIDAVSGTVFVGTRDELGERVIWIERSNWLRWETPPATFSCLAQLRYRHAPVACTVEMDPRDPARARLVLDREESGVSPGQAAVLYDGEEVLGGGWIASVGDESLASSHGADASLRADAATVS